MTFSPTHTPSFPPTLTHAMLINSRCSSSWPGVPSLREHVEQIEASAMVAVVTTPPTQQSDDEGVGRPRSWPASVRSANPVNVVLTSTAHLLADQSRIVEPRPAIAAR